MSGKGDAAVVESHQTPNIAELLNLVQDYEKEIVKLNDELENLKLERKSSNPVTDSVFLENDELKIQAKTDATLIRSLEDSILAMDEETKVLKTENARLLKITESLSTKSTGETEVDIIDSKKLFDDFQILRNENIKLKASIQSSEEEIKRLEGIVAELSYIKEQGLSAIRPLTSESELSYQSTDANSIETYETKNTPLMKRSTEPRQSIPPPTLLTSFEKFDLEKYRNMDPRDLTSDEFLMRIKLLSDTLMTTRRELDTVILQRDELFSKYDEVTLTLCDREKQLAYCEDLIVLSQRDRSQSQPQEQWKEVSDQDQDQDPLPLTPAEQDRLQDASSAALSGMRSVLEEKNRLIERYREKIDKLQSEVPMKSNVDRRAEALLQSLDTDALLVTRSVEFFEDSKEIDRYDRHAGKAESSDAMLSEKNRKINLLETTVETELLRRERAELRCAESVQEMDAMKADMLMLVQRLRQSEQRYVQLLAISSSVDAKPTVVRQSSVRKQEEKEDDEEGRNEEKTIEKGDTEDILDDTINAVDASFVTSPIRSDSTDHLKLHRIVKVREEQIRKHRDVTTKLKAEIVRMEQQHAVALLKVSSTVSKKSDYVPSSGDDLNDLKRQVITLRDTLRETKDDLERSRKAREKLIQLKHSALEDARALASQLTRAEAQAQAYQDTLQRTRSELEETKKKEKKLREKVKEYGADPDLALVSQSSSPRGASIALHKECIMLRTQNAQLRQVITQAALATDDSDSPGKKRKSTLAFLDVEESKNDSYTSEKDENDGYFNGETKLLKRFTVLESRLRGKVSENLDLMAKLSQANAQIMENQARESSAATIVEFGSSKGEKNEQRKSKISVSTPVTNTRSHKPSLDEWIELEQVRSELFSLETENRRLRRRAEVELANEISSLRHQLNMEKAAAKEQIRIHDEQNEKTRADSPLINSVVGPRSLCESEERFLLTERLKDDLQRARKQQIALQTELLERDSTLLELRFDLETKVEEVARWQRRADELQNAYSSTTSLLEQAASKAPVSPTNAAITTMSAVLSVSNSRNRTKREGELEGVIEAMKRVLGRLRNDNDRLRRGGFTHDEDQHNSTPDYEKKAIIEKKRADKLESQLRDMTTKLQDAEDSNRKLLQRQNQVATLRTQLRAKDEETKRIHEEWVLIKEDRDRLRGQLQGLENRISEVNAGSLSNTTNDNPRRHLPTTPSGDRQNKSQFTQQQSKETDQRDQLIALQEENDELTALLREATDTLAMQQAQLKLVAKSTTSVESAQSIPASSLIPQEDILRLQDENKRLRSELSAFDLQFFEEIENLKYSYSEAMKKIKIYEKLYGQK